MKVSCRKIWFKSERNIIYPIIISVSQYVKNCRGILVPCLPPYLQSKIFTHHSFNARSLFFVSSLEEVILILSILFIV